MRFLLLFALSTALASADTIFEQTNLVSDIPGLASFTDPNLKNPWGMSFTATSPFWVSDGGTGVSTLYNGTGAPLALVVSIPGAVPTGQVANLTNGFTLTPGNPARFIFATIDGGISGWNPAVSMTNAIAKVLPSPSNTYTGLALASSGAQSFLYAANFKTGHIDVFDSNFAPTSLAGNFTDPVLPSGYAPFNIEVVGTNLYVEYAKVAASGEEDPGAGFGFVSVFDTNGNFVRRLISGGALNAPWGITIAPASFGDFSSDLLVGNFGDGRINAFDPTTGAFLGALSGASGDPLEIDGLWALKVRLAGPSVDPNRVYFTAGIEDEAHGLVGSIAAVPEPGMMGVLGICLAAAISMRRRLTT